MTASHLYDLVLFTSHFPYETGETFLAEELEYLSKGFGRILLCPLTGSGEPRPVPTNCDVMTPQFSDRVEVLVRGLANTSLPPALARDFVDQRVWSDPVRFRRFAPAALFLRRILSNKQLSDILKYRITPSTVLYFYWSVGFAYAAPFLPCRANPMVARFHGSDLYEEAWNGYAPFRRPLIDRLDRLVFVSNHGRSYLKNRYPDTSDDKLEVFRLGTKDFGRGPLNESDGVRRIVSCSNLISIKRIDLLLKALHRLEGADVEYFCIGDGPELEKLRSLANHLPENVKSTFTGALPNSQIMDFYRNTPVDLFVNVSRTEGLPVSMMEAMSFGIPILGTDVGGVTELVDDDVGVLLDVAVSIDELRQTIARQLSLRPREMEALRNRARARWEETSSAQINHDEFCHFLGDLKDRSESEN